jgi:hypothetical protein
VLQEPFDGQANEQQQAPATEAAEDENDSPVQPDLEEGLQSCTMLPTSPCLMT